MFTKQIPHVRSPNPYGEKAIHLVNMLEQPALETKIPMREMVFDGKSYDVPRGVYRHHRGKAWLVKIKGRPFLFHDDRYTNSLKDSLARAVAFLIENVNKDPRTLRAQERIEYRNKNIELGVGGISAMWKPLLSGKYSLVLRYQTQSGYTPMSFGLSIRDADLNQRVLEDAVGMLVYMKHITGVNPSFTEDILKTIWKRIKKGDISPPLSHPVPEMTMTQIEENLQMRKLIWSGKGTIDPSNNKYVR